MFRSGAWSKPSYAAMAGGGGRSDLVNRNGNRNGSSSNNGSVVGGGSTRNSIDQATRELLRDDQIARAKQKSFVFKQKIMLEEKRRELGKGNILTFLLDPKAENKKPFMNNILRVSGFRPGDVQSIKTVSYTHLTLPTKA